MYAVIKTGGKQHRVEQGQRLEVERLTSEPVAEGGQEVTFAPILLVDGGRVVSAPDALASASVSARIVGEAKGPKIDGFTYKNKSRNRKRWGHRQKYSVIEITGITG